MLIFLVKLPKIFLIVGHLFVNGVEKLLQKAKFGKLSERKKLPKAYIIKKISFPKLCY